MCACVCVCVRVCLCVLNFEESRHGSDAANSRYLAYLHCKVRVLYDDGIWYDGLVNGFDNRLKEYTIRLDDDTCFTTALPDPDVQILGTSAPPHRPQNAASAAGQRPDISARANKRQRPACRPPPEDHLY